MPNYFDYITDAADKYDEPDFIEESVQDGFNNTIADMDLYCFQESLVLGGVALGLLALIGLLIALIRKIISGGSGSSGLKKQTKQMSKDVKTLEKMGIRNIKVNKTNKETKPSESPKSDKPENHSNTLSTSMPASNVTIIEDELIDNSTNKIVIVDLEKGKAKVCMDESEGFLDSSTMLLKFARDKGKKVDGKSGTTARRTIEKARDKGSEEYAGFDFNKVIKPIDFPPSSGEYKTELTNINTQRIKVDIIDPIDKKVRVLSAIHNELKKLENEIKHNNVDEKLFSSKDCEKKYRNNFNGVGKFLTDISSINQQTTNWLQRITASAKRSAA